MLNMDADFSHHPRYIPAMLAGMEGRNPPLPLGEGRGEGADAEPPAVLTCSALNGIGIDQVWSVIAERFAKMKSAGTIDERRRQQNVRWLWSTVDDRLQQAARTNPVVHAMRAELESKVTSGQITPEAAARQILAALNIS